MFVWLIIRPIQVAHITISTMAISSSPISRVFALFFSTIIIHANYNCTITRLIVWMQAKRRKLFLGRERWPLFGQWTTVQTSVSVSMGLLRILKYLESICNSEHHIVHIYSIEVICFNKLHIILCACVRLKKNSLIAIFSKWLLNFMMPVS